MVTGVYREMVVTGCLQGDGGNRSLQGDGGNGASTGRWR